MTIEVKDPQKCTEIAEVQAALERTLRERDDARRALVDIIQDCPRMCCLPDPACPSCQKAYAALPEGYI